VTYEVRLLGAAERDLKALAKELNKSRRAALVEALGAMRADPFAGDVTQLVGSGGLYRRRVGDYRIVFAVRESVLLVIVVLVGDRKELYRVLERRDLRVLGLADAELLAALGAQ
jgi:mRNA interferase RelE/StbE